MSLLGEIRWQDVVDMLIIAFVVYQLVLLIRGTRAVQMITGLLVLAAVYQGAQFFELYTVNWVLDSIGNVLLIMIVVVFQADIRRMLTQVGTGPLFSREDRIAQNQAVEEIVRAVSQLAGARIGALIVLQNEVGLNEYIEVGTPLDARVSRELVVSIFLPGSPVHDGAVIVQGGRLTAAGCVLPLTSNPGVSRTLGTRHRAAIGLTEETDAVVLVVSEEDGTVSLVHQGRMTRDVDPGTLRVTLQRLLLG